MDSPKYVPLRKKFLQRVVFVLSFALILPGAAAAADISGENTQTGANSTNTNSVTGNQTITWTVTNTGTATNTFDVAANTGGNTVTNNTEVGDITTGDIEFNLAATTELNTDTINGYLAGGDLDLTAASSNNQTGAGSTNTNTSTFTTSVTMDITNVGTVVNSAIVDVNTGNNTISNNTQVGDITTGDINGTITFGSVVNGPSQGGGTNPPTPPQGGGGDLVPQPTVTPSTNPQVSAAAKQVAAVLPFGAGGGEFFPAGSRFSQLLGLLLAAALLAGLWQAREHKRGQLTHSARGYEPTLTRVHGHFTHLA